jgi:thiosulfate/3-mercaptopyruvate sulfurtransferase
MKKFWLRFGLSSLLVAMVCMIGIGAHAQQASAPEDIPAAQLLQPAELAKLLDSGAEKPLILQVGSHVLFAEAHIPGSEYAGAGGTEAGLQTLRDRVKSLDHAKSIVIYCGCCPWGKCPNIRAAYRQLNSLGFTHVKALYIATNFGTDWASKGYPVEKGR